MAAFELRPGCLVSAMLRILKEKKPSLAPFTALAATVHGIGKTYWKGSLVQLVLAQSTLHTSRKLGLNDPTAYLEICVKKVTIPNPTANQPKQKMSNFAELKPAYLER